MPFETPLSELAQQIKSGAITAASVMEAVYARIEAHNEKLNAYRQVLPREVAMNRAATIDQRVANGEQLGALAGIPLSIKSNLCVHDEHLQTTCASKMLEGFQAPYNATVVQRTLDADALIIGTTNMDEFAMGSSSENSAYGATSNPWDVSRVSGGSSGGSAVTVATGMALASLGSDTGGSVRQPASFCGVTGFKPTYGALSRYGLVAYGSSLDQVGCLTRTAADAEFLFQAIEGTDDHDSTSIRERLPSAPSDVDLSGLTLCLPFEYMDEETVQPDVLQSVQEMVDWLQLQGATVERRSLDFLPLLIPTYYVLSFAEASSNLGRFDGIRYGQRRLGEGLEGLYRASREEGFGPEVKRRIMLGTFVLSSGYYDAYYGKATQVRAQIEQQVKALLQEFDYLIGPVAPSPAFPQGEKSNDPLAMYLEDIYSVLANLTRTPAISIPARNTPTGLPVGFQLLGRPLEDHRLLRVCEQIQQGTTFHTQRPPL